MAAMANDDKTALNSSPMNIATISAGFEKGDFLVREEQGNRVYFDFFEEVRSKQILSRHVKQWHRQLHTVKKRNRFQCFYLLTLSSRLL